MLAGSGKTLAFLLPLVVHAKLAALRGRRGVKALVVSPTRELAVQSAQVRAELEMDINMPLELAVVRKGGFSGGEAHPLEVRSVHCSRC